MTLPESDRVWLITEPAAASDGPSPRRRYAAATRHRHGRSDPARRELAAAYGDAVLAVALDVTDRAAVHAAVEQGLMHFGHLDVLVNNAGYGLAGGVEEISEDQARRQMEVNFFGALWCTQAVLPVMRAQRAGHIFQISSLGGLIALPNTSCYNASKWALEGLSDSLSQEVSEFGIRVTIVEPGPFRSDWNGGSMDPPRPCRTTTTSWASS